MKCLYYNYVILPHLMDTVTFNPEKDMWTHILSVLYELIVQTEDVNSIHHVENMYVNLTDEYRKIWFSFHIRRCKKIVNTMLTSRIYEKVCPCVENISHENHKNNCTITYYCYIPYHSIAYAICSKIFAYFKKNDFYLTVILKPKPDHNKITLGKDIHKDISDNIFEQFLLILVCNNITIRCHNVVWDYDERIKRHNYRRRITEEKKEIKEIKPSYCKYSFNGFKRISEMKQNVCKYMDQIKNDKFGGWGCFSRNNGLRCKNLTHFEICKNISIDDGKKYHCSFFNHNNKWYLHYADNMVYEIDNMSLFKILMDVTTFTIQYNKKYYNEYVNLIS